MCMCSYGIIALKIQLPVEYIPCQKVLELAKRHGTSSIYFTEHLTYISFVNFLVDTVDNWFGVLNTNGQALGI